MFNLRGCAPPAHTQAPPSQGVPPRVTGYRPDKALHERKRKEIEHLADEFATDELVTSGDHLTNYHLLKSMVLAEAGTNAVSIARRLSRMEREDVKQDAD